MKLLFISHDCSISGAPKMLLGLIKWLKNNISDIYIDVILMADGPLAQEFTNLCNNVYFLVDSHKLKPMRSKFNRLNIFNQLTLESLGKKHFDIIYANTVVSIPFGVDLKNRILQSSKLVVHVHELDTVLEIFNTKNCSNFNLIEKFIAASESVRSSIIKNLSIAPSKVKRIYEFSELENATISRELATKGGDFIVGAVGFVDWRKGYDVFLQVARLVKEKSTNSDIKFLWIGKLDRVEKIIIESDLQKLGLEDSVVFKGLQIKPLDEILNFDIMLLTSREDPFPLACIEAGMLGIPIICFDKGNGICEVVKNGGGTITPYLNVERMADVVLNYYHDRVLLTKQSREVKQIFSQFTADNICPEIYKTIKEL